MAINHKGTLVMHHRVPKMASYTCAGGRRVWALEDLWFEFLAAVTVFSHDLSFAFGMCLKMVPVIVLLASALLVEGS